MTRDKLLMMNKTKDVPRPGVFYIVHDAMLGERTIAAGEGEVQVCVRNNFELDKYGDSRRVCRYRAMTF